MHPDELFMSSSQEETFHLLMSYFNARFDKIVASDPPSYIKAEIGPVFLLSKGKLGVEIRSSWFTHSKGNLTGIVQTAVEEVNGASHVRFDFDFSKEYKRNLMIVGIICLFVDVFVWVTAVFCSVNPKLMLLLSIPLVVGELILLGLVVLDELHNEAVTIERFIEEFDMFAQAHNDVETLF